MIFTPKLTNKLDIFSMDVFSFSGAAWVRGR